MIPYVTERNKPETITAMTKTLCQEKLKLTSIEREREKEKERGRNRERLHREEIKKNRVWVEEKEQEKMVEMLKKSMMRNNETKREEQSVT